MILKENYAIKRNVNLQAEYGDFSKESMGLNYFISEQYFSERVVKRLGTAYVHDHAPIYHKQFTGLSQEEAETEYIKVGAKLTHKFIFINNWNLELFLILSYKTHCFAVKSLLVAWPKLFYTFIVMRLNSQNFIWILLKIYKMYDINKIWHGI